MNLYDVLELTPSASINDIKRNYRRLAKKHHPDKNKDIASITKFQEISTAYEILSDDKSR
jgi:curved DNA-binding protein CbpA